MWMWLWILLAFPAGWLLARGILSVLDHPWGGVWVQVRYRDPVDEDAVRAIGEAEGFYDGSPFDRR